MAVIVAARLRRRSTAARLLRSWFQISPGTWIFVCCECCMLSGRSFLDELISRPEESYRMWCFVVCDLETSGMRRPWPTGELLHQKQTNKHVDPSVNYTYQEIYYFIWPHNVSVCFVLTHINLLQPEFNI